MPSFYCGSVCFAISKVGGNYAYTASRAASKARFEHAMDGLRAVAPASYDKLNAIPHEFWAHYAGRKNACLDQVTTNPAESANSMLDKVSF